MFNKVWLTPILFVALLISLLLCIGLGAVTIDVLDMRSAVLKLLSGEALNLKERIFFEIRLPRALLSALVGATLALGGVLLQALFRNPIIEPGLVGTSSGAALGAAVYFVLGSALSAFLGEWMLPVCACCGAMLTTLLVVALAHQPRQANTNVLHLLLTGIAVNALCLSGVGFLSYIARDPQARSISFWNMGALSGANWHNLMIVAFSTLFGLIVALRFAKDLNALLLGESEAALLGVHVKRLKLIVLTINVIMVAVATAFVGVIGFVGLIVPHILRLTKCSDHRFLLIHAALLGAIVLSLADLFARIMVSPAELPIGIVTSLVGVPVFIFLLRRSQTIL
nr:iron ABC transporter permease [uncultured Undibacterium sp.]